MTKRERKVIRAFIEAWEEAHDGPDNTCQELIVFIADGCADLGDVDPLRKLLAEDE